MKTKISTLFLVFTIQVTVNGQMQDNPANNNSSLVSSSPSIQIQRNTTTASRKILVDLNESSKKATSVQDYDEPSHSKEVERKNGSVLTPATLTVLLKLAEEIESQAQSLRKESTFKNQADKNNLISQAMRLETLAMEKQVEASEISGSLSLQQFNTNKITIRVLIGNYKGPKSELIYTFSLIIESEKDMQLAKEMREEAYAQRNLASKLGTMDNAEEKELLALSKQSTVIETLARAQ